MLKALVIEDNEDNMELITFLLHQNGYETVWAQTGLAGIDLLLNTNPDFVLLDIQLPDIDGMEVLKRIRAMNLEKQIPIIAVTSYAMAGDRERLLSAGCDGYIEKPIEPETVVAQIKTIVGG